MPLSDKIRLLLEWLPALQLLSSIAAKQGKDRAAEVTKLAEFLASKTETKVDDKLARLVSDIVLTPQAGALIDYVADLVNSVMESSNDHARLAGN